MLIILLLPQAFQLTQSDHKLLVSMITLDLRKENLSADSLTTRFSILLRSLVLKPEVRKVLKLHLNSAQNRSPLSEFYAIRMGKGCGRGRVVVIGDVEWDSLAHWIGL